MAHAESGCTGTNLPLLYFIYDHYVPPDKWSPRYGKRRRGINRLIKLCLKIMDLVHIVDSYYAGILR